MKRLFLLLAFIVLFNNLYAQTEATSEWGVTEWALDAGITLNDVLVDGYNIGALVVPKLRLSPLFMLGSKIGVNYSNETTGYNILTIESQIFFRLDIMPDGFSRLNIVPFMQVGMGYLGAFRGPDETMTRSSMLMDFTTGVNIPINNLWYIEPQIRAGYPFILGVAVTIGRRFPIRGSSTRTAVSQDSRTEYVDREVVRTEEVVRVEYVDREVVRTEYIEVDDTGRETELARLRNELSRAETDTARTEEELERTRNDLSRAEAEVQRLRNDLSRAESGGTGTQEELERIRTDLARTEDELERTRIALLRAEVDAVRTEYIEVIRTLPPEDMLRRVVISAVEFILFGPDIGSLNVGVSSDVIALNELTLNETAQLLQNNPQLQVRIEGHANPVTGDSGEQSELMELSLIRANNVAARLRQRGVREEQISVTGYGGTRTVTSSHEFWNRNRRVELIIVQFDFE